MEALKEYDFADAKTNFSEYTRLANLTGQPFVICKRKEPWVKIEPLQVKKNSSIITPIKRSISVVNLNQLFEDHPSDYRPTEDGFAAPVGKEVL